MRNHQFFLAVLAFVLFACYAQAQRNATSVLGASDYTTDGGVGPAYGVYVSPVSGKIFLSTEGVIFRLNSTALIVLGTVPEAFLGQPGQDNGQLSAVAGIFIDENDALWGADGDNNRIFKADNISNVDSLNFSLVLGQTDFSSNANGTGLNQMDTPFHAIVDSVRNNLWVADSFNNRVSRFANASNLTTGANLTAFLGTGTAGLTQSSLDTPYYVALDSDGNLYVADGNNKRVLRFDNADNLTSGANASLVLGQNDFTSNTSVSSQASMNPIFVLWFDDVLYVSDTDYNRVLIFEQASSLVNGANATDLIGQPDFDTSATRPISQSSLSGPRGLSIYNSSSIFVASQDEERVLLFDIEAANSTSPSVTANITNSTTITVSQVSNSTISVSNTTAAVTTPLSNTTASVANSTVSVASTTASVTSTTVSVASVTGSTANSTGSATSGSVASITGSTLPTRSDSPSLGTCGNGVLDAGERCDPSVDTVCCNKGCAFKTGGKQCGAKQGVCYKKRRCNGKGVCRPSNPRRGNCKVNPTDATKTGKCVNGTCVPK